MSDNWIQSSEKRVAYDYTFEEKRLSYDGTHISYCILIDLLGWTYLKSIVLLLVADLPDATVFQQSKIRVQSNSILMCLCQAKEYTNTKPWQRKTTVTDREVDTDWKLNHWCKTTLAHCYYAYSTLNLYTGDCCSVFKII